MNFQQFGYTIPRVGGQLPAAPTWYGLYLRSGGMNFFTPLQSEDTNIFSGTTRKVRKRWRPMQGTGNMEFILNANDFARLLFMTMGGYKSVSHAGAAYTYVFEDGLSALKSAWRDRRKTGNYMQHFLGSKISDLAVVFKAMDDVYGRLGFQYTDQSGDQTSASDTYEDIDDSLYAGNDRTDVTATVFTWQPDGGSVFDLSKFGMDGEVSVTNPLTPTNQTLTDKTGAPIDGRRDFASKITYDFGHEDSDDYEDDLLGYFRGKAAGTLGDAPLPPLTGELTVKIYGPEIDTGHPSYVQFKWNSYINVPDFKALSGDSIDRTATVEFPFIDTFEAKVCCGLTALEVAAEPTP